MGNKGSFLRYLVDMDSAWWLYVILLLSVLELVLVAFANQTATLTVLRILIGLGLLGYFPGYATSRILFPGDQMSDLERVLMSIFLSVAISIAIGVILGVGYFFTGFSSAAMSVGYTTITGFAAAYRRWELLGGLSKKR